MLEGPLLIVGAHADDEVLGAGGTMAMARRVSREVHVMIMSTSSISRGRLTEAPARRRDAEAVASHLSVSLTVEDFPDNAFDTVPALELARAIERVTSTLRPRVVITHWPGDLSLDHRATAHAVLAACRPQYAAWTPTILSFEIRSSTEWMPGPGSVPFQPTVYVPLDESAWAAKLAALHIYGSEMRPAAHARSFEGVDALARLRGTEVGHARAEAFALLRQVVSP